VGIRFSRINWRMSATFFLQAESFITSFVEALNQVIEEHKAGDGMSRTQRWWISFCVMGIIMTNTVCWARFARTGLGKYSLEALSWVFRRSKIPWEKLLCMSAKVVLRRYGIKEGALLIDDTDKKRSKVTKKIEHVHKIKDKASGGFIMGQSIVFLVLVTSKITIPVGFMFYVPDPAMSAWNKLDKALKAQGVPARQRPSKPPKDEKYPTKQEIGLILLYQFRQEHSDIRVRCVLADALYGTKAFLDKASDIFGGIQVISQVRANQKVRSRGKEVSVKHYFGKHPGTRKKIMIRGDKEVVAIIGSARLHVHCHGKKRFVIALKYEGEEEYRYLLAKDMSWTTQDIVESHTLRWLAEVFHEDWKSYEGWGKLTKQQGEEGSSRSLILSLLTDHCLLLHPEQTARIENKLPACTVGSLQTKVKVDSLLTSIQHILDLEDPQKYLNQLNEKTREIFSLKPSKKQMSGRDLGNLEPTASLKYKAAEASLA
jgi:hypothetical protein